MADIDIESSIGEAELGPGSIDDDDYGRIPDPIRFERPLTVILSIVAGMAVPILTYLVLDGMFDLLSDRIPAILVGLIAIVIGVVGVFAAFAAVDWSVWRLPDRMARTVQPYAWIGPAVVMLAIFLVYPAIKTIQLSFAGPSGDGFVGLDNYRYVFTDDAMLRSLRNTVLWIFVVPAAAVAIGLGFAVLADKLRRAESAAKSIIFLPMAISFVGAGIVWRFIYNFRIEGSGEQIGILNAIRGGFGAAPVDFLAQVPWNNFLLMVIMIWLQTGFAMVILSSAIKGVPTEMLEAARLDGATEIQIFWQVIVPSIKSSIVVVFTTMVIGVLKVFDVVWVMTGGQNGTEVIAERMIRNMFSFRHFGRGAAVAVFMFVAVIPVMIINVRRFQQEEALR